MEGYRLIDIRSYRRGVAWEVVVGNEKLSSSKSSALEQIHPSQSVINLKQKLDAEHPVRLKQVKMEHRGSSCPQHDTASKSSFRS